MSAAAERLRSALLEAARALERPHAGRWLEVGRPLLVGLGMGEPGLGDGTGADAAGGIAWGDLDDDARAAWLDTVPLGAVAARVFPAERGGARGLLGRAMLLGSGARPQALEDVCTSLFLGGVGTLEVIELEPRRHIVAVIGTRRF